MRDEEGFGLLELLMSIVILSTAIAGLLAIFLGSAFSLSRAGDQGTATVIIDRVFEYYHRTPWWNIRLVKHGPGNAGGVADPNVTGDAQYVSTAQCAACPAGSSAMNVDEDAAAYDTYPNDPRPDGIGATNNIATCNAGFVSTDPNTDATAPITNCLAITSVTGADGFPYRVYTYMKYACITLKYNANNTYGLGDHVMSGTDYYTSLFNGNKGQAPASSPSWWTHETACPVDYHTKIVHIVVRKLNNDGTLKNGTATGILAQQTESLSFGQFTSTAAPSSSSTPTPPAP
jgi:hypothetical protein